MQTDVARSLPSPWTFVWAMPHAQGQSQEVQCYLETAKSHPFNKMRLMLSAGRAAKTKAVAETVPGPLPAQQGTWKTPVGAWEGAEL